MMNLDIKSKILAYPFLLLLITILNPINVYGDECPEGTYSVISHYRTDYTRKDGVYVRAADVKQSCREYTFFKPLKLIFRNTPPKIWPNKKEKFGKWSAKEKMEIDRILKSLPKALISVGELNLYRARKSISELNPATSAAKENIITIYDNANQYGLKKVLVHELAHLIWFNLDRDNREKYFVASEWFLDARGNITNLRAVVSEEDGRLSPEEDFVNNIEYLISNKDHKNKMSLEIINCLNTILGIKNEK
ncbi:MAG: hypothetical protein K2Q18_01660 [Bdellovibrionales bacterium]|nr:hypothetical protein [Bdellovibrionales bacterium]